MSGLMSQVTIQIVKSPALTETMICQSGEFIQSAFGDRRLDEGYSGGTTPTRCGFILPGRNQRFNTDPIKLPPVLPSYVYRFDGSCLELRPFMEPALQRSIIADLLTVQRLNPAYNSSTEIIFGVGIGYCSMPNENQQQSAATMMIVSHDPEVLESRLHFYLPFLRLSSSTPAIAKQDLTVLGTPSACHLTDAASLDSSSDDSGQYLVGLLGMKDSRLIGLRVDRSSDVIALLPRPADRFEVRLVGIGEITALESFSPGYRNPLVFAGGSSGRISISLFHPKSGFASVKINEDVQNLLQANGKRALC